MAIAFSQPKRWKISYIHPTLLGIGASAFLTLLVIVGSRNLEHFDSALFGYTVASVVAFGAIVFRYALWLQRPATRTYFRRGLQLFFQRKKLIKNTASAATTTATNLVAQKFIFKRGTIALADALFDYVGLYFVGDDYVSARFRLGAFQTRRRSRLSGLSVRFSVASDGWQKFDGVDYVSRARFYGDDGHCRMRDCDSPKIKRPRRDCLSNFSARFHAAFNADRHIGFGFDADGFEPLV